MTTAFEKSKTKNMITLSILARSMIFNLLFMGSALFFSVTGLCLFWTRLSLRYRYLIQWSKFNIFCARVICGLDVDIQGFENLPQTNAIVLCNHQSTWETLFLQGLLPMQSWVLKKQLMKIPLFGWGLRLLDPIAVDRNKKQSIKHLIKEGKKRLEQGLWIVIFPEGTRLKPGQTKKFSRSGEALSQAANYPVIAIAHDAGLYWPKNSFLKFPGTIRVRISPVLAPGTTSITEQAQNWMTHHERHEAHGLHGHNEDEMIKI